MSGICGFFQLDGGPADSEQLAAMTRVLERRGPDRTGRWHSGPAALGHTLLTTTPEAAFETLPLIHSETGTVITADVRLDNREELLAVLDIGKPPEKTGDGEIILHAYLKWGKKCLERLLGDFAFVIWDPREKHSFCARDQMGMRQLIYWHRAGKMFAFATEADAVLALKSVPKCLNVERIVEVFLQDLDAAEITSTFFKDVFRLPPAHYLVVNDNNLQIFRYWTLQPGPKINLADDREYAEALREKLEEAIGCRLRNNGDTGLMLSGGLDSGSIAAIAGPMLRRNGKRPLQTFSAIGPDPKSCSETHFALEASRMDYIQPHFVDWACQENISRGTETVVGSMMEPLDGAATMSCAIYHRASRCGIHVMLDGGMSDVLFRPGSHLKSLIKKGRYYAAWKELYDEWNYYGRNYSLTKEIINITASTLIHYNVKKIIKKHQYRYKYQSIFTNTPISRDFASLIDLKDRYEKHKCLFGIAPDSDPSTEASRTITQNLVVFGRESSDRVASQFAIEQRDPFMDVRLATFCTAIPPDQKQRSGWPKLILRHAMEGMLPDVIRWRRGREHLGWRFKKQFVAAQHENMKKEMNSNLPYLDSFIDIKSKKWKLILNSPDCCDMDIFYNTIYYWSFIMWMKKIHNN